MSEQPPKNESIFTYEDVRALDAALLDMEIAASSLLLDEELAAYEQDRDAVRLVREKIAALLPPSA